MSRLWQCLDLAYSRAAMFAALPRQLCAPFAGAIDAAAVAAPRRLSAGAPPEIGVANPATWAAHGEIVYLTEQHWLLRQSIGPTSNTARRMFAFKVILIRQKQMLRVVHLDLDQGTSALRHKTKPMLAWGPCPVSPAGSTDRRNTFCVLLSWGLKEQGLSWPFIEPPGDRAELGLAMQ